MNWYVIYTKPKWEKKVADQLNKMGIEAYCPLIIQERQWSDRKKKVEVPLFNSYVFVQVAESNRNEVFQVAGVVRYLFWLGKAAIVRDDEIEVIKQSLSNDLLEAVTSVSYKKGDKIVLDSGAFVNQEAIVKEVSNTHYTLILESIGYVLKIKYN